VGRIAVIADPQGAVFAFFSLGLKKKIGSRRQPDRLATRP
jgi:hypothetical protein